MLMNGNIRKNVFALHNKLAYNQNIQVWSW